MATDEALIEELGEVLYQIEFHATIAEQAGRFARRRRSGSTGPTSTARWEGRRGAGRAACGDESGDDDRVADELGDLVVAAVNVARHGHVDAELAVRAAAGKFRRRFEGVESMAAGRGIDVRAADLATLDALWDEVKSLE